MGWPLLQGFSGFFSLSIQDLNLKEKATSSPTLMRPCDLKKTICCCCIVIETN